MPLRQRSLSTSTAALAPLSPVYRYTDELLAVTDAMATFSLDREQRISNLKQAQTESDKLALQLTHLRAQVAAASTDLALRIKLLDIEGQWRRALERERAAHKALNSPTVAGPPTPLLTDVGSTILHHPALFPPSPPRTPSPSPRPRPQSMAFSSPARAPSPTFSPRAPSPRPISRSPSLSSRSSAPSLARSPRPWSPALGPLPISASAPTSDPLPAFRSFASNRVIVTSHLSIPGWAITHELGVVQAMAPHAADVAGLKERLRVEGEKRGAHAVVGVGTRMWDGEQGGLVGVGRAVKLKRI
ncbi:hypothetical protein JCM10207_007026 [Rhodosporidiobolus poonsookiae]